MKEEYVKVNEYKMRYLEEGRGEGLVLVHGIGGSGNHWLGVIGDLSRKFRVIAPDMIGFGYSDKPDIRYSISELANYLFKLVNKVGLKSFNLVGLSLGGHVSIKIASKYQDSVKKLVLVDSAGLVNKRTKKLKDYFELDTSLNGVRKRLLSSAFVKEAITDDVVRLSYKFINIEGVRRAFERALRESIKDRIEDDLRRIRCETLIIWGEKDPLIPLKHAYKFKRLIKNSKIYVIKDCGHTPHHEKREDFLNALKSFLK